MKKSFLYFLFYKPYNVLTRFGKDHYDQQSIADFLNTEKDVYPVGRLDKDSEGLLLLTNDSRLNQAILHPKQKHPKKYWVQVDGMISKEAIKSLQSGVTIQVDGKDFKTASCSVILLKNEPDLPPRNPPIRFRQNIPTSWIQITLTEGKNRQIRKMCAKVGFPVLRLIRVNIGKASLDGLSPGKSRKLTQKEISQLLDLPDWYNEPGEPIKKKPKMQINKPVKHSPGVPNRKKKPRR